MRYFWKWAPAFAATARAKDEKPQASDRPADPSVAPLHDQPTTPGSVSRSSTASPNDELTSLHSSWKFIFAVGLVSVLVGILAMLAPHIATSKTLFVIGTILVIAGITELFHAVMVRKLRAFALHLLAAALYLVLGVFVLEDTERAAGVLTLLFVAAFFVAGLLRIVFSLVERFPAWPWVFLNGVVDLILVFLTWEGWPESSLWVIGLFLGIELFTHGLAWVILALRARTIPPA
jgi:uncharacterized membrane protein HdeD (DUF308 family)